MDCSNTTSTHECSLTADVAVYSHGGIAALYGVVADGQITVFGRGHVDFYGAEQTPDSSIAMTEFATLHVHDPVPGAWGESTLAATSVGQFARAILGAGTDLIGPLTCSAAGDVLADPSITGTITGCPHVP